MLTAHLQLPSLFGLIEVHSTAHRHEEEPPCVLLVCNRHELEITPSMLLLAVQKLIQANSRAAFLHHIRPS